MSSTHRAPRTQLVRHPERGSHDPADLVALLDACAIVHVGVPGPRVVPMAFGRLDDRLFLHGSRRHGTLAPGLAVCVTATLVDGLVVARSAFHHSMNYRSAMIYGVLEAVPEAERGAAATAITNHRLPGRHLECRAPSRSELDATCFVQLRLDEASVKQRHGGPREASRDAASEAWHGTLTFGPARGRIEHEGDSEAECPPAVVAAALELAPRLPGVLRIGDYAVHADPRTLDIPRLLRWLRDDAYWAPDITQHRLLRSLAESLSVGAYDANGAMVGYARAVTDQVTFGWIADVFVDPGHRRRGLARAMTRWLVEHPELASVRRWMLATRDAHAVYAPLGFEAVPADGFMQRQRPLTSVRNLG